MVVAREVPDTRKLHRAGGSSKSVILPKRILDYWIERGLCVEEVDIYLDGVTVVIKPKGF